MTRREFTTAIKRTAWDRANGQCQKCGARLDIGKVHYDHEKPCGLGGEPTLENCQVLCLPCHADKTGTRDIPMIRKADRMKNRHIGAHQSQHPIPGGKNHPLKRKLNGRTVLRAADRTGRHHS